MKLAKVSASWAFQATMYGSHQDGMCPSDRSTPRPADHIGGVTPWSVPVAGGRRALDLGDDLPGPLQFRARHENLDHRRVEDGAVGSGGLVLAGHPDLDAVRSEEHTSELQSREDLVCRVLLEKKKKSSIHQGFPETYNHDSTGDWVRKST